MTPQRLTAIVAMLSAFPVNASELVDRADANGDGYVSLYELRAAYYADMEFNRRIEQSFADYDTNGDGLISETERQAAVVATAKAAPGDGLAATVPGETALSPTTVTLPATAAGMASMPAPAAAPEPVKKMAPISAPGRPPPAAAGTASTAATAITGIAPISAPGTPPPTTAGMASTPATATAPAANTGMASTPTAGATPAPRAGQAPAAVAGLSGATAAGMASMPATDTVSTGTARMNTGADSAAGRSPEVAPPAANTITTRTDRTLPDTRRLSRTELMIQQNDADNSGGASVSELISSGDGRQWFPDRAFSSADKNDDGELDPDELEALLRSMERRRRR